ncbi:outer membrane protein [Aquimarina sp. EL_43]|uniref:Membrane protein n=1 Tax=Aquimarina atlantica TaxID=1317122 RepID=A0A023BWI2_9FLAO|nr:MULTISPECIES: OmpH family outer membrane protein [Aquimarina]EZH74422.1 membrane protein [Aquimarina atlantica]MBG6132925.1 outer membrane protein [Aquimarina sp. EL_35]MBG6152236.1 outer membrane protein [Aquimarina sp. EL_32]MBG6171074.1 outer membrane protein [Aquimarina sp. EL_43]
MKQFRTLLVAIAITIGSSSFVNAQSKVAHIASQELVEAMPAFKAAKSEIEKLNKTYDAEIRNMVLELQNTIKKYSQEAETKTDEENLKRQQEVQATEKSINDYRTNALQDLQKKEIELMKPIYEQARTSIQKVARAQGFQYVLDSTTGTGVIMADGKNLMADVKKDLGI